jgi:uncharacterized protein (TIGR04255 family)
MKLQPLILPLPDDRKLSNAPLNLVIAQVRHERQLQATSADTGLGIRSALGPLAGDLSEHRQQVMTLMAGPGNATAETAEGPAGWQLVSPEGTTTIVQQEFFSIETAAYTTWDSFRDQLKMLTLGVEELLHPKVEQRVGLRYVNTIVNPSVRTPLDWVGRIDPHLLGAVADGPMAHSIRASQQVLEIEVGGDVRANLRHGSQVAPSGGQPAYVLDIDCYSQAGRAFDAAAVVASFEQLHQTCLQLFQACITPKHREEMQ